MSSSTPNPFEGFFRNRLYQEFKNHLYNYKLRKKAVLDHLAACGKMEGMILEIGSGISTMTEGGRNVLYSDVSGEAMLQLRSRYPDSHTAVMSITHLAVKKESLACVICSEVIEHVKDDQLALHEMIDALKPGGSLILTVPVHPRYYAFDDQYVKHERRYAVWPLLLKLRRLGLEDLRIEKVTGFLDKAAMLVLTFLYSSTENKKNGGEGGLPSGLLRILLPIYKALNFIYGKFVSWEAKAFPLSSSAVLLVRGTKKKANKRSATISELRRLRSLQEQPRV